MKRFILISLLLISTLSLLGQEINRSILGFKIGGVCSVQDAKNILSRQGYDVDDIIVDKESSWTEVYFSRVFGMEVTYVPFAGKKWQPVIVLTSDNKLAKISLSKHLADGDFKELLSMYTQKYGEPKESGGELFRWGEDICISLKKSSGFVTLEYYSDVLCNQIENDVYNEI